MRGFRKQYRDGPLSSDGEDRVSARSRKRKAPERHQDQEYTGSYDGKKKKTGVEGKKPVE